MDKTTVAGSLTVLPIALINFAICVEHRSYSMTKERRCFLRLSSINVSIYFLFVDVNKVLCVDFVKVNLVWLQLWNNLKRGTFIYAKG